MAGSPVKLSERSRHTFEQMLRSDNEGKARPYCLEIRGVTIITARKIRRSLDESLREVRLAQISDQDDLDRHGGARAAKTNECLTSTLIDVSSD